MERLDRNSRRDVYGSRINRAHSPVMVFLVPVISIMAGSFLPQLFIGTAVPYVPPLGFLMLLGWRLVRPGIFPVWIGFPLGSFDDLLSGQPFGSAILLWSLAMITIELVEARFPWRNFLQDWLAAAVLATAYIVVAAIFSGSEVDLPLMLSIAPQALLAAVLYPLIARIVARLDRLRLTRFRTVR